MTEEREHSVLLLFAAERRAAARERRTWSAEHHRRARSQRLVAMQAKWRARSAVYDRFGTVLAMADADPAGDVGTRRPGGARQPAPIRALVVLADTPARIGARVILSSQDDIEVIGEASSGDDGYALARAHEPDVVVMGIRLPGTDGLAATRRITAALGERTKVVVYTSFDGDEYEHQARLAGASAFVPKQSPSDELVAAVRAVGSGAPTGEARGMAAPRRLWGADGALRFTPPLTERERQVMYLLAQGLSNSEIGARLQVSVDTVRSHLKHLYAKCGLTDRVRLVAAAQASGFGLAPPSAPL